MKTLKELQKQKAEIEKQKAEIEKQIQQLKNQPKGGWYEYKKGWEITTKQQFNNKTYPEILEIVKESEIADYNLLQKLRNKGLKFLKDFWVFVPNQDKISKENEYVAWFDALSVRAFLGCGRLPGYRYDSLGVFLIRKKEKEQVKEQKQ